MAIEFLRIKLRRTTGKPILLSGGATLHPDGMLDLSGDAMAHADAIAGAIESVAVGMAADLLPYDRILADDCAGCPLARRAGASSCACLQVDRLRVGLEDSLTPMVLRPGLPPAALPEGGPGSASTLWREFARFRMARARNAAQSLVTWGARAA